MPAPAYSVGFPCAMPGGSDAVAASTRFAYPVYIESAATMAGGVETYPPRSPEAALRRVSRDRRLRRVA